MHKDIQVNRKINFNLHMFFKGIARLKGKNTTKALQEAMAEYVVKYGDRQAVEYAKRFLKDNKGIKCDTNVPRETTEEIENT